jgi:hypothetical protein
MASLDELVGRWGKCYGSHPVDLPLSSWPAAAPFSRRAYAGSLLREFVGAAGIEDGGELAAELAELRCRCSDRSRVTARRAPVPSTGAASGSPITIPACLP